MKLKCPKKIAFISPKWCVAIAMSFLALNSSVLAETADNKTHLDFAIYTKPLNMHPWYTSNTWTGNLAVNIFEGLTTDGPQGNAIPALAHSWEYSDDRSAITFRMRPDVKWNDGTPITAKDFYDNYIALLKEPSLKPGIFHDIIRGGRAFKAGEIQQDELGLSYDEDSITFVIDAYSPFLPDIMTHSSYALPPFHALESQTQEIDVTDLPMLPVTGAYAVASTDGNSVSLVANTSYYDHGKAVLETIHYDWTEQSDQTRYHQLINGEIDLAHVRPTFQFKFLKENFSEYLYPIQGYSTDYYAFNTTLPPFDNAEIRRALAMGIDWDRLAASFGSPEISISKVMVPDVFRQDMTIEEPEWMTLAYESKVEKAKEILASHGYTTDEPLAITLSFNESELHKRIAIAVSSMWAGLGAVKVELSHQPLKEYYAGLRAENPKFEVARAGWTADFPDAADFLSLLTEGNKFNYARWVNAEYNDTVGKLFVEESVEKRKALGVKAINILLNEAPVIPLFSRGDIILKNPDLIIPATNGDQSYEFRWFDFK